MFFDNCFNFQNSVNMVSKIILQGMFSKLALLNLLKKSLSLRMEACLCLKSDIKMGVSGSKIRLYADSQSWRQYLKLILIRLVSRNSIFYNLEL
jgi:hypothetical protein